MADHPSAFYKSLPRLPSTDDADDDEDASKTPTASPQPPPSTPITPKVASRDPRGSYPFLPERLASTSAPPASASTSVLTTNTETNSIATTGGGDSLRLLSGLRFKFQRAEQELYVELSRTSERNLNDVRRSFITAAKGATRRLSAWERKHLTSATPKAAPSEGFIAPEPEWWKTGCHAVPGGNVIVRENDWGSIIAFTLRWVTFP